MNAFKSVGEASHEKECECEGGDEVCRCKVKCQACMERLQAGIMFETISDAYTAGAQFAPRTLGFFEGD